ncbi:MAG: IPT/TIG domain-containing protein, partial [Bacteroidetes bacterium]|nr:IPT/TIG domain-containing protein [Bacteroidota bacterium]
MLFVQTNLFAQVPTITSFTPTSGAIGATVTLTGTNFNTTAANNIV